MSHDSPSPRTTPLSLRMKLILGSVALACITVATIGTTITASAADSSSGTHAVTSKLARTTSAAGAPRFFNYVSPAGTADNAGEPSIGINWLTELPFSNSGGPIPNGGTSNYFGGFLQYMVKVTFNDCQSPALATWQQKPLLTANTPRVFGDPILFTDHATGRTFVSQLEGLTPAGSTTDITDNDGNTFSPSQGSGAPSCVDHQTIGGGPFHAPLTGTTLYPNAVYYASQCVSDAVCAVSLDGGFTFGPSVPMFTVADCDGLHGHIKVGPDGTAYVPDKGCGGLVPLLNGGEAAVIVSENNGITWNIRTVPGQTTTGDDDPSVGVATDGTIYLGWQSADGHPRIAVSHDKGLHWINISDVGASLGIQNCAFPAVVAGDGGTTTGRAAFAFYGTTTAGAYDQPDFPGIWYLYIATTFDGGVTWTTQNVTPDDPIQRGGICGSGTCRNMLDFFDMSIDKEGRVLVGWDDGCIGGCVNGPPNSFTAKATITRQSGGKRMFAIYDPVEPRIPEAPGLTGNLVNSTVHLSWQAPDDGGATITAYNVYHRTGTGGPFTLIATVNQTNYAETVGPGVHYYRVTAVNPEGEGPFCLEFSPPIDSATATACLVPGILAVNDLNAGGLDNDSGQNTPPDPSVNIRDLSVAEPYVGLGVNQLTFTLQMAPSTGSVPPNTEWFIIWQRLMPDANFDRWYVAMRTDALGAPSFEYGKFGVPLDATNPSPNANTPSRIGSADDGSYNVASGVITIKLSNSKAENIAAGQSLSNLNVRTYLGRNGVPGQRSQNNASDITANGSYTLVGNASCFCFVDQPPVAGLAATPTTGIAPLTVTFDGSSSSDPDAGDGVGSYTFNFGDGSVPVTQAGGTISHTYTSPSSSSGFFATLTVDDQKCGHQSLNVASVNIEVKRTTAVTPVHPAVSFQLTPMRNPSHHQMDFALGLDRDGSVRVRVFSSAGQRVVDLLDAWLPAGTHKLEWEGRDASGNPAPAGVYFVQAKAGGRVIATRIVLLP